MNKQKIDLIEQLIMKDNADLKQASSDYNLAVLQYRAKVDTELLKLKKHNLILTVATLLLSGSLFLSAIYDASRDHDKGYYVAKTEAVKEQLDAKIDKRLAKLH